ncbi:helicase [Sphingobacteriales bacterium UPWRP_1]|nr:helicase [Sphingobacteriales bacterium UPWRP_1]
MLLDNKMQTDDSAVKKVSDFLRKNTKNGNLDIVTGYFSVSALALLYNELNGVEKYRLILGNLVQDETKADRILDLLTDNLDIESTLILSQTAEKAVAFLQQSKVDVKTIETHFCHAKSYLYEDTQQPTQNYFIVGSSNLTEAGLGVRPSSNIELNIAKHDYEHEFKDLKQWFADLWNKIAQEKITLKDAVKTKIAVKQHLIELMSDLYKKYTPYQLYFKVLYEMFKGDLLAFTTDEAFKREITRLENTIIYQTLYSYQQKGVISLIKMLQKYNGAILADAVGLGKTWTALAVMKYFALQGFTVVLFCPKKLRQNWEQYQAHNQSRFENDDIEYLVRNHTDLQDERLTTAYPDFPLAKLQHKQKLLVVIDESHNLRNDKSGRYKFLVDKVLQPRKTKREVKVLHLSATPINNKLTDVRNQYKLIARGVDEGFKDTDLQIDSLDYIFRTAQTDFNKWCDTPNRKIADFINGLPQKFEKLNDALIVARTRKMIEAEFGKIGFPKKEKPISEFTLPENMGNLVSFDDLLDAIKINMTAYRPNEYIKNKQTVSVLQNQQQREKFLVKMMYILLMKRLESSWFSFKCTVDNILTHHANALDKVTQFLATKETAELEELFTPDIEEELEETAAEYDGPDKEEEAYTLGKKNPVSLAQISDIQLFYSHLKADVDKLTKLKENLLQYEHDFNTGTAPDPKLDKLYRYVADKQKAENKKVLIFTVFKDTAQFLYRELKKRGIERLAYVSGDHCETSYGYSSHKFEPILEQFAPFTKLYNEKNWTQFYTNIALPPETYFDDGKWKVPYNVWCNLVQQHNHPVAKILNQPIEVLIATDCLSEGQNLQDCDLLINYDVHWNPVRLIQRMGRIDRLGSPNLTIKGINFWPGTGFENYLNLKKRVEQRMALMSVLGTEFEDKLSPELEKMVQDNPLVPKQAEKMLQQLQQTWDDIDAGEETLGLNDFSLEQFRQELFEFFKQKEDEFKKIPNGVFTGFKTLPHNLWQQMPSGIIAVLGYPQKLNNNPNHVYDEVFLLHQPMADDNKTQQPVTLHNNHDILDFLRLHKHVPRYVPPLIEQADPQTIQQLTNAFQQWLKQQIGEIATNTVKDLFSGAAKPNTSSPEQQKLEDKFQLQNFDLITWFFISQN